MCRNFVPISDCMATQPATRKRAARDFFQRQAEFDQRQPRAAVGFRVAHAEQAHRGQLIEHLAREGVRGIDGRRLRRDSLVAKARERRFDLALLWAQLKVHRIFARRREK